MTNSNAMAMCRSMLRRIQEEESEIPGTFVRRSLPSGDHYQFLPASKTTINPDPSPCCGYFWMKERFGGGRQCEKCNLWYPESYITCEDVNRWLAYDTIREKGVTRSTSICCNADIVEYNGWWSCYSCLTALSQVGAVSSEVPPKTYVDKPRIKIYLSTFEKLFPKDNDDDDDLEIYRTRKGIIIQINENFELQKNRGETKRCPLMKIIIYFALVKYGRQDLADKIELSKPMKLNLEEKLKEVETLLNYIPSIKVRLEEMKKVKEKFDKNVKAIADRRRGKINKKIQEKYDEKFEGKEKATDEHIKKLVDQDEIRILYEKWRRYLCVIKDKVKVQKMLNGVVNRGGSYVYCKIGFIPSGEDIYYIDLFLDKNNEPDNQIGTPNWMKKKGKTLACYKKALPKRKEMFKKSFQRLLNKNIIQKMYPTFEETETRSFVNDMGDFYRIIKHGSVDFQMLWINKMLEAVVKKGGMHRYIPKKELGDGGRLIIYMDKDFAPDPENDEVVEFEDYEVGGETLWILNVIRPFELETRVEILIPKTVEKLKECVWGESSKKLKERDLRAGRESKRKKEERMKTGEIGSSSEEEDENNEEEECNSEEEEEYDPFNPTDSSGFKKYNNNFQERNRGVSFQQRGGGTCSAFDIEEGGYGEYDGCDEEEDY